MHDQAQQAEAAASAALEQQRTAISAAACAGWRAVVRARRAAANGPTHGSVEDGRAAAECLRTVAVPAAGAKQSPLVLCQPVSGLLMTRLSKPHVKHDSIAGRSFLPAAMLLRVATRHSSPDQPSPVISFPAPRQRIASAEQNPSAPS